MKKTGELCLTCTTIHLAFPGRVAPYKKHYCLRAWENCLIARMLWSKYD